MLNYCMQKPVGRHKGTRSRRDIGLRGVEGRAVYIRRILGIIEVYDPQKRC